MKIINRLIYKLQSSVYKALFM